MPQIDFSTYFGQIFWLLFFFILTYLVVSALFLPRIGSLHSMRNTYTKDLIDEAEEASKRTEVIRSEINMLLSDARTEAFNKRVNAKLEAKNLLESSCAKIESDTEKAMNRQLDKINRLKRELIMEAGDVGQDLALDILHQVLNIENVKAYKV